MGLTERGPRIDFSRAEARAAEACALRLLVRPAWRIKDGRRFATHYQNLEPGDLMWVAEEYVEYIPKRRPLAIGIGYGGIMEARPPQYLKHHECSVRPYPSCHMRRETSRLTVEVVRTRCGALQSLPIEWIEETAIQRVAKDGLAGWMPYGERYNPWNSSARELFTQMWNQNNDKANSWDANPLVVAIRPIIHLAPVREVRAARSNA